MSSLYLPVRAAQLPETSLEVRFVTAFVLLRPPSHCESLLSIFPHLMIHPEDASPLLSLVHSPELAPDVLCRDGAVFLSPKTEADRQHGNHGRRREWGI